MQDNRFSDWLVISTIAFLGGVVSNIIIPARRGLWGFVAAAMVGIFCGWIAAIIADEWGFTKNRQLLIAAGFAVIGDRLLSAIFVIQVKQVSLHTTVNGNLQQNVGQEGGDAKQH